MKLFATAAAVALSLVTSAAHAAPSRSATISAASNLSQVAYDMNSFAQSRGYYNTAAKVYAIAQYADRIEIAARFGTVLEAQRAVNQAVFYYIDARQNINAIPYLAERNYVRSTVRNALNATLAAMGETPVYSAPCPDDSCSTDDAPLYQLQENGGQWSDDAGGDWSEGGSAGGTGGGWSGGGQP